MAAWQAITAWLSSACGAPNNAISPSPPSLLTIPRLRRTAVRMAISAGSSREIASSGSRSEIRSVERCRSEQSTVRNLRSPAIRPLASDTGGLGGWWGTIAPHAEQNRSPALSVDEQTWQGTLGFLHPPLHTSERSWTNKPLPHMSKQMDALQTGHAPGLRNGEIEGRSI